MDDLTQDEIEQIYKASFEIGTPDREFCVLLTQYMMGYLRNPPLIDNEKIDDTRQVFFRQIKRHLDDKATK